MYLSEDSKTAGTYSSGQAHVTDNLDDALWDKMVEYAHTGNIFITKDSYSYGYRHGHVGVVQSHIYEDKFIVEATEADRPADEVIRQKLRPSWGDKFSLCMVYPNTNTVGDRERSGNQTAFYAEGTLYTYKFNNTKSEAKDSDARKLNCVGVAVRAYHFMANYDIIPQVNNTGVLLPSHIYYSPNIRFKYYSDGSLLRTPGFEEIEWGFGWN